MSATGCSSAAAAPWGGTWQRGRVTGVEATIRRSAGPPIRLTVKARAVVVACGAVHTPAVLRRSGLTNPAIGRGLRLHPATAVAGVFPHRVEPWSGALQTRYSEAFANLGVCYYKLNEQAKAVKAYERAVRLDPKYNLDSVPRK